MKKNTICLTFVLLLVLMLRPNIYSQQCSLSLANITFESANSLTFDVLITNTGTTDFNFSNGSFAWTYDTSILNGGTASFSLVPGFSDFLSSANPPSALITAPNILRTSSNLPGSNGLIQVNQTLLFYRFRLETSASSFSSQNFNISWKNDVSPKTGIYSWNSGSGLPEEVQIIQMQENAWINELHYDNFGTDVGEFIEVVIENPGSYLLSDFQVTLYNGSGGASYNSLTVDNFTVGGTSGNYVFYYWDLPVNGLQNGAPDGLALSYQGSVILGQFLSYEGSFTATDGPASGLTSTDIGVFEPSGVDSSLQLSGTGTQYSDFVWSDPAPNTKGAINNGQTFGSGTGPDIIVTPSILSDFSYLVGGGPSASQSYDLSGSDLTPLAGNITVTGSTNYEVSLDNATFSTGVVVPYIGGALTATPVYVRLMSGLAEGEYNGELIANAGGGATTQNVICNGAVIKGEPTNNVTNFTGVLGNPTYYYNDLSWTDATGGTIPDGYLLKRSYVDFASIVDPVDGVPETNTFSEQNVVPGVQLAIFSGFAGSTYYYKIFPYTNSGSYINYKTDGVPQFSLTNTSAPSLPITENFEYATGSLLSEDGWVAHSGAGSNPIQVVDNVLTYPGYINSGLGKSVKLNGTGEDVNRVYDSVNTGSIYASFMVNVDSAYTSGTYFFHFGPENSTFDFRARVFVQNDGSDNLAFGVSKSSSSSGVVYTTYDYTLNTTYLIVVKYTFNPTTTDDDTVKLWVNPVLDGTEPPSDLTQTDTGIDPTSLGFFALRQGFGGPYLTFGGLRVATSWVPELGATTFPLTLSVGDGWNMVSVPGINPSGMDVDTWWSGKDPAAGVFKYNGGYTQITTTTPTEGYWMKNSGAQVYNYPDIQIVPHNDVPLTLGWNLIGLYENTVATATLQTSPAGIITTPIFEYSGGYTAATDMVPGYGYWAKADQAGSITSLSAPPLAKGKGEVVEFFPDNWGKIILTDATGINYTLYAVKGQVDLDKYELPPMPPAGMFDIRYGSGRIAEDINSSLQTIEMSGVTYPITVRVDGMDIRLMDESGQTINVNLKSGEDVVIGDATIKKLMVTGELIPAVYALEQNYPNPFNPSTTIEFSLPEDVSNVQLSIYNVLGEKVAEIVNSSLTAGKYSYQWNAKDIATGMYIYELRSDNFVSIKKMLLLK